MKFKLTHLNSSSQFKQRGLWISALLTTPVKTDMDISMDTGLPQPAPWPGRENSQLCFAGYLSRYPDPYFRSFEGNSHHYFHLPQTICTE